MVGQIVEGRAEFQPLSLAKPELPLNGKVGIPGARSAQNTDTAAAESPRGVLNESCCIEPGIHLFLAEGNEAFQTAWRTLQGIETVHMIRKGRVRWLAKGDAVGQGLFIAWLFGLAA